MRTSTWTVQGHAGTEAWRDMTTPYIDRGEALARLEHFRAAAQPSVSYRLVRETTVVTRTVEEA
ncbi:hypothetical protein [Streptomyces angustmyceticus]|uniref:hypothetical protein n=1 Tax=Streptomyces angustmyceticus TaxID=285578 RepID=UPI00344BCC31